jgi:hypothetical protein
MENKRRSIFNIAWFIIILSILATVIFLGTEINQLAMANPLAGSGPITPAYIPSIFNYYPLANPFGVALYHIDTANGLDALVAAKTSWTRVDLTWSTIQPVENGPYTWDPSFDQELINASNSQIQPVVIIGGTPIWAVKNLLTPCGPVAENKFAELAQFAAAAVNRYSVPPYNVKYWELYNEPDVAGGLGCWGDSSDAQYFGGYYYGQMLQVVYPVIKAANPDVQVMVGGLLLDCDPTSPPANMNCLSSKFLEGILMSGAGSDFDGVSFHAYDYYTGEGMYSNPNWHSSWNTTGPVSIAKANYLKTLLTNFGQGQKFLMATETALFYGPNVMVPPCQAPAPEGLEVTKAYYLVESYATTIANGWIANIWYSAFGVRCSGLLSYPDMQPMPAYYSYQFAAQKLIGAHYLRNITEYPGVMGYEYIVTGHHLWVLWSLDGNTHTINLSSSPVLIYHIGDNGRPVQEINSMTTVIDLSPRFIQFYDLLPRHIQF